MRLYAAHNRRIYGYVRSLIHNASDVEEVFQNTCEVLWEKFDQFTPGSNFFAWSCSIARFEALSVRRRRGRDAQVFSDDFYESIADFATELGDDVERLHDALAECFGELTSHQQEMIELRYAAGGTTKTVAEKLDRTTNAIYKSLRRVHEMLFNCIERKLAGDGQERRP